MAENLGCVNTRPVPRYKLEHPSEYCVIQQMGLKTKARQFPEPWCVIVTFGFAAWVADVIDLHAYPLLLARRPHFLCELLDREGLCELIEDAQGGTLGRIAGRQIDALDGILQANQPPRLAAPSVDGQRVSCNRLGDEPVENRPEQVVVLEVREQLFGEARFVQSVDDALHQVGHREAARADEHLQEVGVHDLAQVVDVQGVAWEKQPVGPSTGRIVEPPLGDLDVWCAVFAETPEFDKMALRAEVQDGPGNSKGRKNVIGESESRLVEAKHRVRRGALLGQVYNDVGLVASDNIFKEDPVRNVADMDADGVATDLGPTLCAPRQTGTCEERFAIQFAGCSSTEVVVDGDDRMTFG